MAKRIFIAIHYMEIGGAERALLGFLSALEPSRYDVDLFVYRHTGELMSFIPEHIRLLPENEVYACLEKPLKETIREGHWNMAAARLWARIADRLHNSHLQGQVCSILDEVGRAAGFVMPSLHHLGEYDLAVSFLSPHYVVRDKVMARKKAAWIHTDYSSISINAERELAVWAGFDHIVSISEDVTRAFLSRFPSLASKIILMENMLPSDLIRRQAEEFDASPEMPGHVRLLSIGRYSPPKNFPGAVEIMAGLCRLRNDAVWYIIGYGGGEQEIRDSIRALNMQDRFILLGKRVNPYPYIKACDLYIQPSVYEGKAVTVKEAQFLGKPVAITNFPTAHSQLDDGQDGVIIPLGKPAESALAIHELLEAPDRMEQLAKNCRSRDYVGRDGFIKMEKLMC